MGLLDRASDVASSIKAPATNLTLGSAGVGLVVGLLTAFNDTFTGIFGENASENTRRDILLAVILAWAAIAVADLFSRAITTAASDRATAQVAAAAVQDSGLIPVDGAVTARIKTSGDGGYRVVAMRTLRGNPDENEYLLIKSGKPPIWQTGNLLDLTGP